MTTRQYIINRVAMITAMKNEQLRWGHGMVQTIEAYRRSSDCSLAEMNYLDGQTERAKDKFFKDCTLAAAAQIEKDEKARRLPDALDWVEVDTVYAAQALEAEMNFAAEIEAMTVEAAAVIEAVETSSEMMAAARHASEESEIPAYAAYTLIASYWYREAYKGLPLHVSQVTGRRAMCLKFAQWYDQLAGKHIGDERSGLSYTTLYKIWRDGGYTVELLKKLCRFESVVI